MRTLPNLWHRALSNRSENPLRATCGDAGSTAGEDRAVSAVSAARVAKARSSRREDLSLSALCLAGLFAATLGCGGSTREPVVRDPLPPVVEESYAIDDSNRPLTEEELDQAAADLASDGAAFVSDLEKAPPVRQASLIFVLQQDPAAARDHRDVLEKLSASEHGIVSRAALFALEAADEQQPDSTK